MILASPISTLCPFAKVYWILNPKPQYALGLSVEGLGCRLRSLVGVKPLGILGSYWGYIGVLLGSYWGHIGVILGLYWGYIGVLLGLYWGYIGVILGLYWGYIGVILGLYWGYTGVILALHVKFRFQV